MNPTDKTRLYIIRFYSFSLLKKIIKDKKIQFKLTNSIFDKKVNDSNVDHIRIHLNLTDEEVDIILEELSDMFISKGLNKNSEPNEFGLKIEDLINVFTDKRFAK